MTNNEKRFKIGIFGAWRGGSFIKIFEMFDDCEVYALCDKSEERMEKAASVVDHPIKFYTDFDEFLNSGVNAIMLCNYFHQHAEYAIKALEKGIHVFSETMAAPTPALCVALCRAVEKSGCVYMLAENYPFSRPCTEMTRVCKQGNLGQIVFAEGEYVHPMSPSEELRYHSPDTNGKYHWRRFLPSTYYSSHSLAPLMCATGLMPKKVIGKAAPASKEEMRENHRLRGDSIGIMLVEMDNGAIFRISGSAYVASHANWYRVSGEKGTVESVRGTSRDVRVHYNNWCVPEGEEQDTTYRTEFKTDRKKADSVGHGGGDYYVIKHFVQSLRKGKAYKPLDVYHAVAMAAVAIFGWRSAINGSKQMNIPNFRLERVRKKWENDNLTPFPDENGYHSLPYTVYNYDISQERLNK